MRLLYITTVHNTLRGCLLPFAAHFRKQGWSVEGMAQGVSGCCQCVKAFDHVWEVNWSRNPLNIKNLLVAPRQIRQIVSQKEYQLIHVHTPVAAFVTRYALRNLQQQENLKVIYTAHGFHFYRGGPPLKNLIFLVLEKLAGRWTDYLVVINHEDEQAVKRHNIVPRSSLRYIPGIGIDTHRFRPKAVPDSTVQQVRHDIGLIEKDHLFLMVAAFNSGKRHRDAIRAFSRLNHPTAHLVFAGTGPLMSNMKKLAEQLGVRRHVHFLGYRRDIPALMRAATALLLPSEREGLPLSVMEALSLEVPVIGADIRGIRDLLQGGCGLLVKVADTEALTRSMAWVIDHPQDIMKMGRQGRAKMATYDLRYVLNCYDTLYNEVRLKEKFI